MPIFDRPFLQYQIDLLRQVPEIDEIVLSLNYQPRRIEEVFGDGGDLGIQLRYVVEPTPLGTGGAIKFAAGDHRGEPIVVFNGDVFTSVDLPGVIALHRERKARATIVLTPVENPSAYGLVETDAEGNVLRFLEKPRPDQIRCDTINAGHLRARAGHARSDPEGHGVLDRARVLPVARRAAETFVAHIDRGYWIDIGTPEKYRQAHRDIMDGRFDAPPFRGKAGTVVVAPRPGSRTARSSQAPCFIDAGAVVKAGRDASARTASIGRHCHIGAGAVVEGAILWPNTWVDDDARIGGAIAGRHCHFGRNVEVGDGAMFGDKSVVTDYSRA